MFVAKFLILVACVILYKVNAKETNKSIINTGSAKPRGPSSPIGMMENLDVIVTRQNARVLLEWKRVVEEDFVVVGTFLFVVLQSAVPLKIQFAAMETNAAQKIE